MGKSIKRSVGIRMACAVFAILLFSVVTTINILRIDRTQEESTIARSTLDQVQLAQYDLEPEESRLYQALMTLPAKYRIVLYMHYYEDYSAAQIAAVLGSRVSTITTRLSRGRACLKQALERCEEYERTGTVPKDL